MICALGFKWDKEQVDRQDTIYLTNVVADSIDFIGNIFNPENATGKNKKMPLMNVDQVNAMKSSLENFKNISNI